jgi:DNA-directed RNA polymerase subunit M/transcription elongation factor TFIIS
MHTEPTQESEGTLSAPAKSEATCRECKKQCVTWQVWASHCGGYEDYKYTCGECGHVWWVDGIDS